MRPRFQADADLHPEIVAGAIRREPAVDFQYAQWLLSDGMTDSEVLRLCAANDRILVSPTAWRGQTKTGDPVLYEVRNYLSYSYFGQPFAVSSIANPYRILAI